VNLPLCIKIWEAIHAQVIRLSFMEYSDRHIKLTVAGAHVMMSVFISKPQAYNLGLIGELPVR